MLPLVKAHIRARSMKTDLLQEQWMGVQILIGRQVPVNIQINNGIRGGMSILEVLTLSTQLLLPIEATAVASVDKG